jgi:hypothetical protein
MDIGKTCPMPWQKPRRYRSDGLGYTYPELFSGKDVYTLLSSLCNSHDECTVSTTSYSSGRRH